MSSESELKQTTQTFRWALSLLNPGNLRTEQLEHADDLIMEELKREQNINHVAVVEDAADDIDEKALPLEAPPPAIEIEDEPESVQEEKEEIKEAPSTPPPSNNAAAKSRRERAEEILERSRSRSIVSRPKVQQERPERPDPLVFNPFAFTMKGVNVGDRSGKGSTAKVKRAPAPAAAKPVHPAHRFKNPGPAFRSDLRQERHLKEIKKNCERLCLVLGKDLKQEIAADSPKEEWILLQEDLEEEEKQFNAMDAAREVGSWVSWFIEKGVESTHPIGLEAENWGDLFDQNWAKRYQPHVQNLYFQSDIPMLRELPPTLSFVNNYVKDFKNNHLEVVKRKAMAKAAEEAKQAATATAAKPAPKPTTAYKTPPPDFNDKVAYAHWYWREHDPAWYNAHFAAQQQQQQQQPEIETASTPTPPAESPDTSKLEASDNLEAEAERKKQRVKDELARKRAYYAAKRNEQQKQP